VAQTTLLPPFTTIRLAWSLTGKFSQEAGSQEIAALAEQVLKDIQSRSQKSSDREQQYINGAISTIQSSLRSLDTIYKGRELNFKENGELRAVYLETVKENLEFGKRAQDFLKSLPTMTFVAGAGTVTLSQLIVLSPWQWVLLGLGLAGLGYMINVMIVHLTRRRQQQLYLEQDYERNLYYDQYVTRVRTALFSLYLDLDRIHWNSFGQSYPINPGQPAQDIVEDVVKGIRSSMCPYVHKHMSEHRVTPQLWARCESGGEGAKHCPLWEGSPPVQ
jgi:hypothetical protein